VCCSAGEEFGHSPKPYAFLVYSLWPPYALLTRAPAGLDEEGKAHGQMTRSLLLLPGDNLPNQAPRPYAWVSLLLPHAQVTGFERRRWQRSRL
jgi:hypothetical protein